MKDRASLRIKVLDLYKIQNKEETLHLTFENRIRNWIKNVNGPCYSFYAI